MASIYSPMFRKFKDNDYRNAFIAAQIRRLIPKQVRGIREAQEMTQQQLADAAGTTQTVISRIEKGSGSGNLTVKSLLNLANALDVALVIRFEPIDRLIGWTERLSSEDIAPRRSQAILVEMEQQAASAEWGAADSPVRRAAQGSGQSHPEPSESLNKSQQQMVIAEKHFHENNFKLAS